MPANGRKSIFVTGAASGMGRATAKLFVEKGWFVGAFDVNPEGLASRSATEYGKGGSRRSGHPRLTRCYRKL